MSGRRLAQRGAALVVLGAGAACGRPDGGTGATSRPTPARFSLVASTFRDTIGAVIPAVTVQAQDSSGRALAGVPVQWTTPDAGGSVTPATAVTDAQGLASARWQLGLQNGTQTLSATTAGLPAVTALAYVSPGAITSVAVVPSAVTLAALGDTTSLVIRTTDRAGNAITGADLAWTTSDSGVAVPSGRFDGMPVTARGVGTATLAVRAGTARATVAVTVPAYARVWTSYDRTCAATTAAALFCWGDDLYGALGDGTAQYRSNPVAVLAGTPVVQAGIADYSVCALAATGGTACTGFLSSGARADLRPAPAGAVPVAGAPAFVDLSAGKDSWCGLTAAGAAYCWGADALGQLGTTAALDDCGANGFPFPCARTPVAVAGGLTFARVRMGPFGHACGITPAGAAYCWGNDYAGHVGAAGPPAAPCDAAGLTPCRRQPTAVAGGLTFADVQLEQNATCGLTTDGAAYCWGPRGATTGARRAESRRRRPRG